MSMIPHICLFYFLNHCISHLGRPLLYTMLDSDCLPVIITARILYKSNVHIIFYSLAKKHLVK